MNDEGVRYSDLNAKGIDEHLSQNKDIKLAGFVFGFDSAHNGEESHNSSDKHERASLRQRGT